jgi:hypothetical protein
MKARHYMQWGNNFSHFAASKMDFLFLITRCLPRNQLQILFTPSAMCNAYANLAIKEKDVKRLTQIRWPLLLL